MLFIALANIKNIPTIANKLTIKTITAYIFISNTIFTLILSLKFNSHKVISMNSLQQNQKNLKNKIRFLNMKAKFNDTKITSVATFSYVESFKQIIGLPTILEKSVTYKKAANSTDISSNLSVTEITVPLPKWQRARRFVV